MEKFQDDLYHKGYVAGYRDGVCAAVSGKNMKIIGSDNVTSLPIKAMRLSTRAYNCLSQAGCTHVADVTALSGNTIATMRNLGPKTASEIARWLDEHGICYSVWSKYL